MEFGLQGKYALITGGTHGIGLATALGLAGEGCHIAVCSRNKSNVSSAVTEIQKKDVKTFGIEADVLQPADIDRVMAKVIKEWGTLHILINNVGGGGRWGTEIIETTDEKVWEDVYNKNTMAAVRFTQQAIPLMRKEKWGRVVTISSIYGKEAGGRPWFNMAKSAEISFMKSLARSSYLVRDGITFNTVSPGSIMIPGTGWEEERKKDPQEFDQKIAENFPLGRLGTPDEVASAITYLCSSQASLINGSNLVVDGGESRSF